MEPNQNNTPPKTTGKSPAFQFYPNDWMHDLDEHSLEIRGAWITILCKLWWEQERGKGTKNLKIWSKILNLSSKKARKIIDYLDNQKIADVVNQNGLITITCRRMVRDEYIRNIRRTAGALGGNPNLKKGKSNPYYTPQNAGNTVDLVNQADNQKITPSSSSSSRNKELNTHTSASVKFSFLQEAYPKKIGLAEALKIFQEINPDDSLFKKMLDSIEIWKATEGWQSEGGRFVPNLARWLKEQRWLDEISETPPTDKTDRMIWELKKARDGTNK